MNIRIQGINTSFFGGGLLHGNRGLKSTQEKLERQEERDSKVAFYEQQKENLKNMKCNTVEEIAKKLDMFHSYEVEILAAKIVYNNEQMMHIMDESREMGEKIAEAVEKMEPKTPEERLEDMAEEAMGIDGDDGILEEVLDEVAKIEEELEETVEEELTETMVESKDAEGMEDKYFGADTGYLAEYADEVQNNIYKPIDIRL